MTFSWSKPPDNKWGSKDEHGNWNGLVQQLIEKKADIG